MKDSLLHTIVAASIGVIAAIGTHLYLSHKTEPDSYPNKSLTPGVSLKVTKEQVCVKGYAQSVRNVTESEKNQVYKRYGISSHKPGQYEVDHLVSLELGGSNDIENLWPQSYSGNFNAHEKDKLENKLHEMVCEGTITLEEAQREISTDWIAAYEKYISN